MTDDHTEYRDVPGFPGYRVGSDGSAWSCCNNRHGRNGEWKKLLARPARNGYPSVALSNGSNKKAHYVHTLVLSSFVGKRPSGAQCRHLNGDRTDNRPANLAWGTAKDNAADMIRHNRSTRGDKSSCRVLCEADIPTIRFRLNFEYGRWIAEDYGVDWGTINKIKHRRTWNHVA